MEEISREKVIKGLECHFLVEMNVCEKCPYYPKRNCSDDMAKDALALLKEREPVEPIRKVIGCGWRYFCDKCGNSIVYHQHFCQKCGRAVKWE